MEPIIAQDIFRRYHNGLGEPVHCADRLASRSQSETGPIIGVGPKGARTAAREPEFRISDRRLERAPRGKGPIEDAHPLRSHRVVDVPE